jgi:hypothetical protein
LKQIVSLAALLAASTVGLTGCNTTADSGSQGTLAQEEATETKAEEDMGRNAF